MAKTTTAKQISAVPTELPAPDILTFDVDPDVIPDVLPPPERFAVTFLRDRVERERHEFAARPELSYKDMKGGVRASGSRDGRILLVLEALIRRSLCDDDGTPARWEPEIAEGVFLDPDGHEQPVAELAKWTDPAAGSSLRRWVWLMDHPDNDNLTVTLDQVMKIYEHLAGKAAGRPTRRSSR
jgi:hypothetical protein